MRRLARFIRNLLLLLVLLAIGAAGAVYFGAYDVAADREHWKATRWLMETVRERSVARQARAIRVRLPEPMDEDTLHEAVIAFEDMCAGCHAPPGQDPGALARGLNPPAPDLTDAARELTAAELFWVTRHGIRMSGMPAWGETHADAELWPIIGLIRQFPVMTGGDYEELLDAALATGIVHEHNHEDDNEHGHDDSEQHDHEHGESAQADPENDDHDEHEH